MGEMVELCRSIGVVWILGNLCCQVQVMGRRRMVSTLMACVTREECTVLDGGLRSGSLKRVAGKFWCANLRVLPVPCCLGLQLYLECPACVTNPFHCLSTMLLLEG